MIYDKEAEKSQYKNVRIYRNTKNGQSIYQAQFTSFNGCNPNSKFYESEREAAKAVDMHMISNGRTPVNILTKKNQ